MKNFVASGKTLTYTVPAETTVASGQLLNIDGFVGVVTTGGVAGDEIEVMLEGVFRLAKATGTGEGFTRGQVVYYNETEEECVNAASGEGDYFSAGYAWGAFGDDDATVDVFLVQAVGLIDSVAGQFINMPVDLARLAQGGATDGQVLTWNNGDGEWQPAGS